MSKYWQTDRQTEANIEQQTNTVRWVLDSNLQLSDELVQADRLTVKEAIIEQQTNTVRWVLDSNLQLSDELVQADRQRQS